MSAISQAELPVFITNLANLIETALDALHEVDRTEAENSALLDRATSLLTIGQASCEHIVERWETQDRAKLATMLEKDQ
jgi:hypothetical protein